MGEAHIGHEWDSTKESSEEDVKVATLAMQEPSSTPRLFNNMSDDDDYSPHICLMAKNEKVKTNSKPSPTLSDESSDLSDSSSDDGSSDDEEYVTLTRNLDPKTKLFITKLMEDLESVQAKLATRDEDLSKLEKLYIASKEAHVVERGELATLRKGLANEQEDHARTKKANVALNEKYCVLNKKHKELELQYSTLRESNPHLSTTKDTSTPSTSQGCGKCYNVDLNAYATNLANMKAMKKEMARFNTLVDKGCQNTKKTASGKENQPKRPQYIDGRNPRIKDGLGHVEGNKTNGRKVINGFECVQFMSRGLVDTERPAQSMVQRPTRAA